MKNRKELVLTGYRVQYVDLRQPRPRIPQEDFFVTDRQWENAIAIVGSASPDAIKDLYAKRGFRAFSVEQVKTKRTVDLDLRQLWAQAGAALEIAEEESLE